ncbi:MAG: cellulase family glycosylhydrolase [Bacteroidales bacterium]|nr:cellulase family glycosylhydrolase [Bacteroidales bacterium]
MRYFIHLIIFISLITLQNCKKEDTNSTNYTVIMSQSRLDLSVGDSVRLTITIVPDDGSDNSVAWESSNSSIASVNETGLVIALSEGSTTVSAITTQGRSANCQVYVENDVPSVLSLLRAEGNRVVNEEGDTIMLRGTNAGSWLVQEDWMTGNTAGCQLEMLETLNERFGPSVTEDLIDIWEENWITEDDLDNIQELGFNCVRVPFTFMNLIYYDSYQWKYDAFDRLDWIVEECDEREIYVILDMHGAPGSQNGSDHSGIDGGDSKEEASEFFFGENAVSNQAKFYEIWEEIADRYADENAVAGYDLLNEPFCTYRYSSSIGETALHNLLFSIYDEAYSRIRAIDPNHMIIMEATWDPWDLPNPSTYGWTNVMYEYHNYQFSDYDNVNGEQISSMTRKLNNIRNYDDNYNVPNLMGEFCFFNNPAAWEEGMALINSYGVHWTSWSYKVQASYGNWGIYHSSTSNINIYTATESEIRSAWSSMTTTENTTLADILSTYATGLTTF